MSVGIYSYTNKINGKMYIGQSKYLEKRKNAHYSVAFNPSDNDYNSILHQAIRKYGYENFDYDILEECDIDKLNEKEIYWIAFYDTFNNGYNATIGGNNVVFKKLNMMIVEQITEDLKNSELNGIEISNKYNINDQTVSDINTGKMHKRDINYPIRENKRPEKYICPICGGKKSFASKMCTVCQHKLQQKSDRPEPLELAKEIIELGFEGVGRKYGVSGNSIKKWCVSYGMGKLKQEVTVWYENNKAS